VNISDLN